MPWWSSSSSGKSSRLSMVVSLLQVKLDQVGQRVEGQAAVVVVGELDALLGRVYRGQRFPTAVTPLVAGLMRSPDQQ